MEIDANKTLSNNVISILKKSSTLPEPEMTVVEVQKSNLYTAGIGKADLCASAVVSKLPLVNQLKRLGGVT